MNADLTYFVYRTTTTRNMTLQIYQINILIRGFFILSQWSNEPMNQHIGS